jgi:hypothetical protein
MLGTLALDVANGTRGAVPIVFVGSRGDCVAGYGFASEPRYDKLYFEAHFGRASVAEVGHQRSGLRYGLMFH